MLACHGRKNLYYQGLCGGLHTLLILHTSCPVRLLFIFTCSIDLNTYCTQEAMLGRGPADEEGADFQGATTWRIIHWTTGWETTKRESCIVLLQDVGRKEIFKSVLERWTCVHVLRRAHPGLVCRYLKGRVAGCLGEDPWSQEDRKLKAPPPRHPRAKKWCQHHP